MDLEQILADVENELRADLQGRAARLAKGDDDKSGGSSPDAASAAGSPDAGGGGPPPPAASSSAPPGADAPPGAGAPPDAAAGGAPGPDASMAPAPDASGAQSAPADLGALKSEYEQLPVEELQLHYLACKAALFSKMGSSSPSMSPSPGMGGSSGAAPAGPGAGAPPGGMPPDASSSAPPAPASAASSSAAPPPPAMKGEMGAGAKVVPSPGNGGKMMGKSEQEQKVDKDALADIDTLKKTIDGLTKVVEMMVVAPQRKSIKGISELAFLGKTESVTAEAKPLTKSEVKDKLAEKAKSPSLSKSDKDLIRSFYVGNVGVDKVEHLLK